MNSETMGHILDHLTIELKDEALDHDPNNPEHFPNNPPIVFPFNVENFCRENDEKLNEAREIIKAVAVASGFVLPFKAKEWLKKYD